MRAVFMATYDGMETPAGSIAVVDGALVVEGMSDAMKRSIWEWGIVAPGKDGPRFMHPDQTPAAEFVAALPDAFGGAAMRVRLESE